MEIDDASVLACVANDVNVLQVDLESGLSLFADGSFDCVILSETLQTIHSTEFLLREMLRVGREGIVSFPNFGHWNARLQIALGRMPVSETLPYEWYETPNVHHCTITDFEDLCRARSASASASAWCCTRGNAGNAACRNLSAALAVYRFGARLRAEHARPCRPAADRRDRRARAHHQPEEDHARAARSSVVSR